MANYDVVSGLDLSTLNDLSNKIYTALYPVFFSGNIVIDNEYIYSVSYDIKKPLVFDFNPSESAKRFLEKSSCEGADEIQKSAIMKYIDDVITIGVTIPSNDLGLKKGKDSSPIQLSASFSSGASIDVTADSELMIRVLTATVKIPADPVLEELVNQFAVPVLIEKVNEILAKGFIIPPLNFGFISFSTPVAAIQNNTLLAFAALASKGPSVAPPNGSWPVGRVFGFFDDDVANITIANFIRDLQKSGKAKASVNIGICDLKVEASYSVGIRNPVFKAQSGNIASVGIEAYGGGGASLKCGLAKPSIGIGISAAPNVSAGVVVDSNNSTDIVFESVNDFKVKIDITNLPDFLKAALNFIINAIAGPVAKLIGSLLSGLRITVFKIPQIPVTVEDTTVVVTFDNLAIDTISDSAGTKYVGVEGNILVSKGDTAASLRARG